MIHLYYTSGICFGSIFNLKVSWGQDSLRKKGIRAPCLMTDRIISPRLPPFDFHPGSENLYRRDEFSGS